MTTMSCGLDFGTTNSTLGIVRAGRPALVALEDGHRTIPTALFFSREDGRTYAGRAAVFEYVDGAEGRFMRALKSVLGSQLMGEKTLVGRERLAFAEIVGLFLKVLKDRLETETGGAARRVVLGRPVHFVDDDPAADRAAEGQLEGAARAQGFEEIAFQFEPVAAALDYEQGVLAEELALVVDIGGGTSDFSVIRLSPERARAPERKEDILSFTGVHIGGTDFDRLLSIARVMPALGLGTSTRDGKRHLPVWYFNDLATWHRINLLYDPKVTLGLKDLRKQAAAPETIGKLLQVLANRAGHRLAGAAEAAKIALTDADAARIRLVESGIDLDVPVARDAFDAIVADLVAGILASVCDALRQAGVGPAAIDTVLLTGGSTQVPIVRQSVTALFPDARLVETDAFGSVGLGLALDAARKFG